MFRIISLFLLGFAILGVLSMSSVRAEGDDAPETYTLTNGDVTLVVPLTYLDPVYSYSTEGVWVYVAYPDFKVLDIERTELEGLMAEGKIIDFSLSKVPAGKEKETAVEKHLENNRADKKVGDEFGLIHYTQSAENSAHLSDVWVDSAEDASFIVCNEGDKSTCSHYLYVDNFYMIIFYPKTELQHWATIKEKVSALYNSFKTE